MLIKETTFLSTLPSCSIGARHMRNIRYFQRNFSVASSPLLPIQHPSRMEAHFWYTMPDDVTSAGLLNQYMDLLSPCEKENVLRMRGEELQKRALIARALVRTTIARYQTNCQVSPESLKFRKNTYGKPEVVWENDNCWSPLQFNISHTSSLIACGVTVHSPIGIDVEEKVRKLKNNILAFARRYFCPDEVEFLASISDSETQRQEFIKLWTLKEAYVKALGRGFSAAPFKTFTIRFKATEGGLCLPEPEIIVESSDDPRNLTSDWHFALFELAGSHYAAICIKKDKPEAEGHAQMKLTVRRTIPLVEDNGTDSVLAISGLKQRQIQ